MDIQKRALYNLLKMNWQLNPDIAIEPWQAEDYRSLTSEQLFERLAQFNLNFDQNYFLAVAENYESPEELTDHLIADEELDIETQDKAYLVIFELWRRLFPEKLCLSVFCDEFDRQINLYDQGKAEIHEALEDSIALLQSILDDNADRGIKPTQVFESVITGCAHDVETFLYDFISDQIENGNISYATELIEGFSDYVKDPKWFEFLKAQVASKHNMDETNTLLADLIKRYGSKKETEFNLELLSFMTKVGNNELFHQLFKLTLPIVQQEEDFQDLLTICSDYYHFLDMEEAETGIQKIVDERTMLPSDNIVDGKDPHRNELKKIMQRFEKQEIRSEGEI